MGEVDEPRAKLVAALEATGKLATSPRCLGCTFQGAASEFPDVDHPGHQVALGHKQAVLERFAGLARDAGLRGPDSLAAQLLLLMDRACVAARMFGPVNHGGSVGDAATALIEAHTSAIDNRRRPIGPAPRRPPRLHRPGRYSSPWSQLKAGVMHQRAWRAAGSPALFAGLSPALCQRALAARTACAERRLRARFRTSSSARTGWNRRASAMKRSSAAARAGAVAVLRSRTRAHRSWAASRASMARSVALNVRPAWCPPPG